MTITAVAALERAGEHRARGAAAVRQEVARLDGLRDRLALVGIEGTEVRA